MSAILKSDEQGVLHLPATLLPLQTPHTAYVVDRQNGSVVISPSQAESVSKDNRTPEERVKAFRQWVDSLPRGGPGLSDWAVSRDSIYD